MSRKTVAQALWLARVAAIGCIVCKRAGYGDTPAELHHVREKTGMGMRENDNSVIPLCHAHHRTGGYGIAFHAGRQEWERRHGTQAELLEQVRAWLS